MSADLLRRAAQVARTAADTAPRGPWTIAARGPRGYPQSITNQAAVLVAETFDAPDSPQGAPRHIALWHPGVARMVADLLDDTAEEIDAEEIVTDTRAEAVARALLAAEGRPR